MKTISLSHAYLHTHLFYCISDSYIIYTQMASKDITSEVRIPSLVSYFRRMFSIVPLCIHRPSWGKLF